MSLSSIKNIFTVLLTVLGLTLGGIAMAAGPQPDDEDDDRSGGAGTPQVVKAGEGTDKDDDKDDDSGW